MTNLLFEEFSQLKKTARDQPAVKASYFDTLKMTIVDELAKKLRSDSQTAATDPASDLPACPKCGGLDAWLPLRPGSRSSQAQASQESQASCPGGASSTPAAADTNPWLCLSCRPPPARGLIDRIRGPVAEQLRSGQVTSDELKSFRAGSEASEAPGEPGERGESSSGLCRETRAIIAMERPTCPECLGAWIVERGKTDGSLDYRCWSCRGSVSIEQFQAAMTPEAAEMESLDMGQI